MEWRIGVWVLIGAGTRLTLLRSARRRPRVLSPGALVAADARGHSLRTRALPEDSKLRGAAAVDSCRRIEAAAESLVAWAALARWLVVLPFSRLAGPLFFWAVGQAVVPAVVQRPATIVPILQKRTTVAAFHAAMPPRASRASTGMNQGSQTTGSVTPACWWSSAWVTVVPSASKEVATGTPVASTARTDPAKPVTAKDGSGPRPEARQEPGQR